MKPNIGQYLWLVDEHIPELDGTFFFYPLVCYGRTMVFIIGFKPSSQASVGSFPSGHNNRWRTQEFEPRVHLAKIYRSQYGV
jgi:hypothetical protein